MSGDPDVPFPGLQHEFKQAFQFREGAWLELGFVGKETDIEQDHAAAFMGRFQLKHHCGILRSSREFFRGQEIPLFQSRQMDRSSRRHRRSEEHTSELQSRENLVCRLLLEKKKTTR